MMGNVAPVGFPLSPLQKVLWPDQALTPESSFCEIAISGELDTEQLRNALYAVARRHESLRTLFQQPPGLSLPFQVIQCDPEISWDFIDLSQEYPAAQDGAVQALLDPGSWPKVTLSEGPALSIRLIRIAACEHICAVRVFSLCTDERSFHNLFAEIAGAYEGRVSEDDPLQYADFSEWHTEQLSSATNEFWSSVPAVQRVPFERRVPAAGVSNPQVHRFLIDTVVLSKVAVELPSFLVACWSGLLWRLTNQDSITINCVSDGRADEQLQSAIGLFARPLPISWSFDETPSFDELFTQSHNALAAAERWHYQYDGGSPGEVPAGIGFEFHRQPETRSAGGVTFSFLDPSLHRWPFQLTLSCSVSGRGIACELFYDARLVSGEDVARIAKYFERTIQAASSAPGASLLAFDLLDDSERRQVHEFSHGDRVDYADALGVHQLFEAQAELTPGNLALVFAQTRFTYAELNIRANQIAHHLRAWGVGPNIKVGLCLERSAEMIVALLAILKAGGAYVPLLPDMPRARLAHQLAETEAPVIVTLQSLVERIPDFSGRVLCLDRDRLEIQQQPQSNLEHRVTLDDLVYVLYTSGSTGTPKGVAVRHGNLRNYTRAICGRMGLRVVSPDGALNFATVSTLGADLGNTAIFPALVSGGCLSVIGYDAALDGRLFAQRNREHRIDVLKITPSNMNALLLGGDPEGVLPRRHLILGGEASSWELVRRVHGSAKCAVWNHYGPTEATVGCLTYSVQRENDPAEPVSATVPVGRPLSNTRVYVLDAEQRPTPIGVPGEIYVGGDGIAAGYIGRPEETSRQFPTNPLDSNAGRTYRTGDRGRFLADGSIEFLGRIDNQVKIRGHRVELSEIEFVLNRHPAVKQAVVLVSPESGEQLVAYLVADPAPAGAFEKHLRENLPEYMIPARLIQVGSIPLNANGKIDLRGLAKLNLSSTPQHAELVAPRDETEERLVAIWKEVLRLERVGIRDNFFEVGGHSLLATQVVSRIRAACGVQVTIRMLFESPTIESLAVAMRTAANDDTGDPEIVDLLSQLEGLSDQEAEDLLAGEIAGN
jgi:amino acid adenylation domain-containing protein